MAKLSIVIPQFRETEEQMFGLFSLLNIQENADFNDFEVVLVNGGSDSEISDEYLAQFKNLRIKKIKTPYNGGSGVTRQFGIDNASADWIFCVDGDDTIFSNLTVAKILDLIDKNDCDVIVGKFLEEIIEPNTNKHSYAVRDGATWVHGKIYRKSTLEKFDLRFPNELRVNEDSYFNGVLFNLGLRQLNVDDIFTIWRANPKSLTRINDKRLYLTGYPDFIKSKDLMLEKVKQYVSRETYEHMVIQSIYFFYFNSQDKWWNRFVGDPLMDDIDFMILQFYEKYFPILTGVDQDIADFVYQQTRSMHFSNAQIRERESFEDYFWRLREKFSETLKN